MIITLCGSTKFKPRFVEVKKELESYGIIVEMPPVFSKSEGTRLDGKEVSKLECLHFEKISYSDYIYVINCGGYIGKHTRKEIEYARMSRVKIIYDE